MPKEIINPPNVHRARGYSHAVKCGNTIYTAGEAGIGMDGKIVSGDIVAQTEQTYENLKRVLEACGAKMTDIVRLDIFTRDFNGFATRTGELRKKYFGNYYPPTVLIGIDMLGPEGSLVEIEAVAVID